MKDVLTKAEVSQFRLLLPDLDWMTSEQWCGTARVFSWWERLDPNRRADPYAEFLFHMPTVRDFIAFSMFGSHYEQHIRRVRYECLIYTGRTEGLPLTGYIEYLNAWNS